METAILGALQGARIIGLTQLMALISALGNGGFIWVVTGIVMLFFATRRGPGIMVILSVIITGILVGLVLTNVIGRAAPCDSEAGIAAVVGVSRAGMSFPSFHAASSFAAATVLALTCGRGVGVPAYFGAVLISFSRLFCGVNWPTDILVGAVLGIAIGAVCSWVFNQYLYSFLYEKLETPSRRGRTSVGRGRHSIR